MRGVGQTCRNLKLFMGGLMAHTKRLNLNRGYMKLDVWKDSVELFRMTYNTLDSKPRIDLRLRSQILDSTQSISSNIAEGYCRRSINEYLQFLNVALGSCGESLTRLIGLMEVGLVGEAEFERFDGLHYSVENQLLGLVRSLQRRRKSGDWNEQLPEAHVP